MRASIAESRAPLLRRFHHKWTDNPPKKTPVSARTIIFPSQKRRARPTAARRRDGIRVVRSIVRGMSRSCYPNLVSGSFMITDERNGQKGNSGRLKERYDSKIMSSNEKHSRKFKVVVNSYCMSSKQGGDMK
jgi:hypothetical protein